MDKDIMFELRHLNGFTIIEERGRDEVKCNRNVEPDHLYVDGKHNRWIIPLRAISRKDADILIGDYLKGVRIPYAEAATYFMNGVIWEDKLYDYEDLPMKMENVSAVFDYVEDRMTCVSLTLFSRSSANTVYNSAKDIINNIMDFKKLLMDEEQDA